MPSKKKEIFSEAAASTLSRGKSGSLSSQGINLEPVSIPVSQPKAVITQLSLEAVLPDPYQSRGGLLPLNLMIPVYNGQLPPAAALDQWISHLDDDPLYRQRYDELCDLAVSIQEHGLINPIHVYHPPLNVDQYRIESGERRYWAHWLLAREEPEKYSVIRAIVEKEFSVHRQVDENEDVSGLSAVGEARNIARAYLIELKINPPLDREVNPDTLYDYFHQVALPATQLLGQQYLPHKFWEKFTALTKRSRGAINDRLDVFKLPRRAVELADAANLNFAQIGEILRAERDDVREELAGLAALQYLTAPALRKLARLSIDNYAAYQHEIAIIRGQAVREKRKQGTPLEVHSSRLVKAVKGLDKLNEQEYSALAERIATADPQSISSLTASLEKLITALKVRQPKAF